MVDYTLVDTEPSFAEACISLARLSGPSAVDVERAGGFRYSQRAYLIQVYRTGGVVYLFDAAAIHDFAPLQEAIRDEQWILHAASQDLPSLRERGLDPAAIFDTELAARLAGHPKVGLAAIVEETLGIGLAKEHSASDWSTRPLPPSWLEYAALDVSYLPELAEVLAEELEEQGKADFAAQEFAAVLTRMPKPPLAEPWRRLRGLHEVRGARNLAVARSLWQTREAFAASEDIAPGRLVPDRSLIAAVLAAPQSRAELGRLSTFQGRASRSELTRWWDAIVAGRQTQELPRDRVPNDSLPPPRAWGDRNPEADRRLKASRAVIDELAEALSLPAENLITPEYLRRTAWDYSGGGAAEVTQQLENLGARPWQVEQSAQKIADAFVAADQEPVPGSATDS